ncbi:MAG: peptidylprolyl isomerase [Pseudomonadota bacterium]
MMKKLCSIILIFFSSLIQAQTVQPVVELQTNLGNITLELDARRAPITSKNFLQYVEDGFYNGTIFHRVIPDYMAQGGGYTAKYENREASYPAIRSEADNGLQNLKGTVAMVRHKDPHTAKSQFFINLKDNSALDYTSSTARGWGYTVFGRVTAGLDVLDKIQAIPTGKGGPAVKGGPSPDYLPEKNIIIKEVVVKAGSAADIVPNTTNNFRPEEPINTTPVATMEDDFDSVDLVDEDIEMDDEEDMAPIEAEPPAVDVADIDLSDFEPEPPDVPAVE